MAGWLIEPKLGNYQMEVLERQGEDTGVLAREWLTTRPWSPGNPGREVRPRGLKESEQSLEEVS